MKNIYVYTHMFTFADEPPDEPPDIWITFGAIYKSTSFHGKKFNFNLIYQYFYETANLRKFGILHLFSHFWIHPANS